MDAANWKGMRDDALFANCAICHTRHADKSVCHLYVGTLEEALKWATGQDTPVEEVRCKAKGDPYCQFVIGATA